MSRRLRRILTTLGTTLLLLVLYARFFGFQTLMVLETRWVASKSPVVKLTPKPLPTAEASTDQGTTLSYFGHEFEIPWNDLNDTKSGTHFVRLSFRSGKRILVSRSGPREGIDTLLEHFSKDSFRKLYGDAALNSDYVLWTTIVNATPAKVTLFTSRQECVRTSMLLPMKAIVVLEDSGLYAVQTPEFKGFQWGDPEKHPRRIVVSLFADDGGMEFSFWPPLGQSELRITQAEINRVLQTLHKSAGTAVQMEFQKETLSAGR